VSALLYVVVENCIFFFSKKEHTQTCSFPSER